MLWKYLTFTKKILNYNMKTNDKISKAFFQNPLEPLKDGENIYTAIIKYKTDSDEIDVRETNEDDVRKLVSLILKRFYSKGCEIVKIIK